MIIKVYKLAIDSIYRILRKKKSLQRIIITSLLQTFNTSKFFNLYFGVELSKHPVTLLSVPEKEIFIFIPILCFPLLVVVDKILI